MALEPEVEHRRRGWRRRDEEFDTPAILIHVEPREFIENILNQIVREIDHTRFREQIRMVFEELSEEIHKFQELVACLVKPHVSSPVDIISDVRTMSREYRAKLLSVISSARAVLDRHMAALMQEQKQLLDRLQRGEVAGLSEEEIIQAAEKMRQMYHLPIYVMIAILMISLMLKKLLYLNLPGHERSPVANILIGYELIKMR